MNTEKKSAHRINILLVDDNPDNLRLLSNMLTKYGYQTRRVISGQMALQAAKATKFDLILLDINMPQMDGYEVCRQLKADSQTASIPVIFISALNEVLDKAKAFSVGGVDYISKPFHFEEMIARVKNQVQILNLQQKLLKLNSNLEEKIHNKTKQLKIANQELKQAQQNLLKKSLKDPVTNLDNKISFMGHLRQAIKLINTQPNYCFALLVFDCYCPQFTNQAFDLQFEDSIAIAIAKKLANLFTFYRAMARLEGNEFAVIIDGIQALNGGTGIAKKIQENLALPLYFNEQKFEIEVSYGIAIGVKDSPRLEYLFNDARTLARQAKKKNYCILPQLQQEIDFHKSDIFSIGTEFEQSLKRQKLTLLYQPIISLVHRQIKELEIVLAWSDRGQIISSSELAYILQEKAELSLPVLKWMFQTADYNFKKWQEIIIWNENSSHIDENITIRFKLLEQQLLIPKFAQQLKQIITNLEINRSNIVIEISEVFVQKNSVLAQKISHQLKSLGVTLSVDNLSTRYLALNSQYNFLIDNLKLASSLVTKIDESARNEAIIKKIIGLARELNMTVTATDIETSQQLKSWQQLGCKFGGGNFFSKPVASQEIENLVINNPWLMSN